jgi:monooxygenase
MRRNGDAFMDEFDVLIIGAGISGIGAAYHLQQRCPDRSYAIIEARDAIGGTWDLFRYPGIRSDSDMYTFGYAFRPWTDGQVFADGPSIRQYVTDTAEQSGITENIRFGERLISASFDSVSARWTVEIERGEARERVQYRCRFFMACTGYYRYDRGYQPDFEGIDRFKGEVIHPQHWPEEHDYTGKRVVVIGSGATAVTLVPAMAEKAAHVTMLQRSPTYIAARPSRDDFADFARKILPGKIAYSLTRLKNVLFSIFFYGLSQRFPNYVKNGILKTLRETFGDQIDVDKHFTPSYNPWDQRFCLAPDGDFFEVLKSGEASIATDDIECFTETGIRLKSGEELPADLVIPATGLEMQLIGGAELSVDGVPVEANKHLTYRGMMLGGVPNFAIAFGYTNASWTLKIDLTCERVCRMLNHMRRDDYDICVPEVPGDVEAMPLLSFSSGYVQRALSGLPQQGSKPPWRTYQNYFQDMMAIRFGRLDDGHMRFARRSDASGEVPAADRTAAE